VVIIGQEHAECRRGAERWPGDWEPVSKRFRDQVQDKTALLLVESTTDLPVRPIWYRTLLDAVAIAVTIGRH